MSQQITDADLEAIIRRAIEQARKGDAVARKWIAEYAYGKARRAPTDATVNGLPADVSSPAKAQEALALLFRAAAAGKLDLDSASGLARLLRHLLPDGTVDPSFLDDSGGTDPDFGPRQPGSSSNGTSNSLPTDGLPTELL